MLASATGYSSIAFCKAPFSDAPVSNSKPASPDVTTTSARTRRGTWKFSAHQRVKSRRSPVSPEQKQQVRSNGHDVSLTGRALEPHLQPSEDTKIGSIRASSPCNLAYRRIIYAPEGRILVPPLLGIDLPARKKHQFHSRAVFIDQ